MAFATVNYDVIPLYEGPSLESPRVNELLYGMSVQVVQQVSDDWCYLRTDYNYEGYSPSAYFTLVGEVAASWRRYNKVLVLAPYVDVQKLPDDSSPLLASVPRGGQIVPLGATSDDDWQKVGLATGAVGYTRASYLGEIIKDWQMLSEKDMRWNLVETALSYVGTAYRIGGRTPLGIDAIGLAAMTYHLNGVTIPQQLYLEDGEVLHQIPRKKMKDGDLLYFPNSVGIYAGNNKFVHATDSPGEAGVVVSSLRAKDPEYRPDLAKQIQAVGTIF